MSYYTEKTLSSIRSIIDEWSIRKEGGKQSFFILKEMDKLLADTPIDDVVSSKDVADKRNEVKMLRLRIAKHKACERLREIERKSLNDPDEISDHIINKNLRRIRIKQQKTIDELTETTGKLEGRLSSMYAANSDQDTTINKLNALLADEKMTLAAYRNNPLSDQVADRDNRIEQLIVLNEALRIDMELAHNLSRDHIAGQDRFIEGLKTELDARNTVIKDFKAIEQKETDRLHTIIDELNSMYCDVCGKLERIENISKKARTFGDVINRVSANHIAIDEITKIIQEE